MNYNIYCEEINRENFDSVGNRNVSNIEKVCTVASSDVAKGICEMLNKDCDCNVNYYWSKEEDAAEYLE